jgi:hypothetical protein
MYKYVEGVAKDSNKAKYWENKSKCKKCKCEDIQTVVVVDKYTRVVQGVMTPNIVMQREEIWYEGISSQAQGNYDSS